MVQQLLENSADVLATNSFGNTPIHTACLNGHSDVLTNLLTVLAELKENVFDLLNSSNQSPLHLAAASPSADRCFDLLMQEPLGMISHKKSLITSFGHKKEIKNFIKKFDSFHEKILTAFGFWFIFEIKLLILK